MNRRGRRGRAAHRPAGRRDPASMSHFSAFAPSVKTSGRPDSRPPIARSPHPSPTAPTPPAPAPADDAKGLAADAHRPPSARRPPARWDVLPMSVPGHCACPVLRVKCARVGRAVRARLRHSTRVRWRCRRLCAPRARLDVPPCPPPVPGVHCALVPDVQCVLVPDVPCAPASATHRRQRGPTLSGASRRLASCPLARQSPHPRARTCCPCPRRRAARVCARAGLGVRACVGYFIRAWGGRCCPGVSRGHAASPPARRPPPARRLPCPRASTGGSGLLGLWGIGWGRGWLGVGPGGVVAGCPGAGYVAGGHAA